MCGDADNRNDKSTKNPSMGVRTGLRRKSPKKKIDTGEKKCLKLVEGRMSYHCKTKDEKCNKARAIPVQTWTGPRGCRKLRPTEFLDSRYLKVVKLPAVRTGHRC